MKPIFTASFPSVEQAMAFKYNQAKQMAKDYHVIVTANPSVITPEFKLHQATSKSQAFINAKKYGRI